MQVERNAKIYFKKILPFLSLSLARVVSFELGLFRGRPGVLLLNLNVWLISNNRIPITIDLD